MVGEGVGQQQEPLAKQILKLVCQEVQRWVSENFHEIEQGDKPVRVVAEADETSLPAVDNLYVHRSHVVERIYDRLSAEDQRHRHEGVRDVVLDMLDSLKTVERQSTQISQIYISGINRPFQWSMSRIAPKANDAFGTGIIMAAADFKSR